MVKKKFYKATHPVTPPASMKSAYWQAMLGTLTQGFKSLGDIFGISAAERTHTHNYAIPKGVLIPLVISALRDERTEPYLAAMLLAANISEPVSQTDDVALNWDDYLTKLITQHNSKEPPFNTKRRLLLKMLIEGGLDDYEGLREGGFMTNHYNPTNQSTQDTVEQVMVHQNDNVAHNRIPTHINGNGVNEVQGGHVKKTYSAIPKSMMLPLLKHAMHSGRMNIAQAATMMAINCHSMELRRSGERYLDHVMGVAADPRLTPRQRVIALLHDVLENSNYTTDDLRDIGFPSSIITSLEHITKLDHEKVYLHFIQRVGLDRDAAAVKRADIKHNSHDAKEEKIKKYQFADLYLEAIEKKAIARGTSIDIFYFYVRDTKRKRLNPDEMSIAQYERSDLYRIAQDLYANDYRSLFAPEDKHQGKQAAPSPADGSSPQMRLAS
jgi:DNA-binding protein Fis